MEIALFPLRAVLVPGAPLPLHVFEPRCRALVADCQAAGTPFGVVCISAGREVALLSRRLGPYAPDPRLPALRRN
jgi:Lon protease-like protein